MRQFLLIAGLLAIMLLVFGCGSDEPTKPETPKLQRIVVTQGTVAPPLNTTTSTVWNAITPTAVDISTTLAPAPIAAGIAAISDSVYLQALTLNDSLLYLRISWTDATHNVHRGAYTVRDTVDNQSFPVTSFNAPDSIARQEDQLWVLFAGLASGDWDGLNWRALTTDSTFLAEGINLHKPTGEPWSLITDAGSVEPTRRNIGSFQEVPIYFHHDTSSYFGYTLFENDSLRAADNLIRGWDIGQEIPSYILDSTKHRLSAATRGSRWDTKSISTWSGSTYTVVMCRPMTTGYDDDVALTDSVKTKIGIFDNQMDMNVGGTGRGFSKEFWLIF